jgi:hypothetical protein
MSSSAVEMATRASHVVATDDELVLQLVDGRKLSVPLVWFPRLLEASTGQRNSFRLIGDGEYINWPELDEDLSVAGLLRGISAAHKPGA